ncbi:Calcium-transporting ATPase 10, plasma membrane-type [Borealophlyctis nickersoniae]|nr:Calcium-transporting ATPase 10, plasma membrane-type [Borealophlyctis nickersoniae]
MRAALTFTIWIGFSQSATQIEMQTGTVYSSTLRSLLCPRRGSESPSTPLARGSRSKRNGARRISDFLEEPPAKRTRIEEGGQVTVRDERREDGLLSERYLAKGKHTFVPTPSADPVRFDVNVSDVPDVERDGKQLVADTDASPAVDNTYCGRVALNGSITERACGQQILEPIRHAVYDLEVEGRHPQWKVSVDFGRENVEEGKAAVMRLFAPNPASATPSWLPLLSVPVGPDHPVPSTRKRKAAPSKRWACSTLLEALYRAHASGMCVLSATAEMHFRDAGLDLNVVIRVWLTPHAFKNSCEAATSAKLKYMSIETYDLFRLMYPTEGAKSDAVADASILGTLVPSQYPISDHETLQPKSLLPTLLNFQKRAVAWMLGREGVMSDSQGNLVVKGEDQGTPDDTPLLCRKIVTDLGNHYLVNDLTGAVGLLEENIANDNEKEVLGGILADEMGLGKTVMLLALILLHRPSSTSCPPIDPSTLGVKPTPSLEEADAQEGFDENLCQSCGGGESPNDDRFFIACDVCDLWYHGDCVGVAQKQVADMDTYTCPACEAKSATRNTGLLIPSSCTLVITPAAILNQWGSEISTHAPHVNVFEYKGVQAHPKLDSQALANFDVVLTTYEILRKEIHFAVKPADRARRFDRKYKAKRSPLVGIQWWRVVLDEAQMIESSVTQAAEMARLIPRVHPWAVTGTPIGKNGLSDLCGLVRFLDLEPLSDTTLWKRLESPTHIPTLLSAFRRIMHRNTKQNVQNELTLPPQTEEVVLLDFSRVEQRYYDDMWEQCLEEINVLDQSGGRRLNEGVGGVKKRTAKEEEVRSTKLRSWLLQLRQTCCHPQVGKHNRKILGGELRTIGEVLELMLRTCTSGLQTMERSLFTTKIYRAQMNEFQERYAAALEIYQHLLKEIRTRVGAAEEELQAAESRIRESRTSVDPQNSQNADEEEFGDTEAGAENGNEVDVDPSDELGTLTARLNAWQELEHRLLFFIASVHHSMKNEPAETEYYGLAEKMRRRILAPEETKIKTLVSKFERFIDDTRRTVSSEGGMLMTKVKHRGGISSGVTIAAIEDVVGRLNRQWERMLDLRARIVKALVAKLEDAEGGGHAEGEKKGDEPSATGEEYGVGLGLQEEGFKYQEIYVEFLNDRRELLMGFRVDHKLVKESDITLAHAASFNPDAEAKVALNKESRELRKPFKLPKDAMHLRLLLAELKKILERIRQKEEIEICKNVLGKVGKECDRQIVKLGVLEKEMSAFRRMSNSRLLYYRRLQFISDGVTLPDKPVDIETVIGRCLEDEAETERKLVTQIGRKRYLENLMAEEKEKLNREGKEKERDCAICKSDFEKGAVTPCGHIFCAECLKLWIVRHKRCPTCKQPCHPNNVTTVSFKHYTPTKPQPPPSSSSGSSSASSSSSPPTSLLTDLQSIKISGSFGTKLDTIIRHIQYIRSTDPTAKALVFSQWEQVLDILGQGLTNNNLRWVKLEGGSRAKGKGKGHAAVRFKEDPEIAVFMLNARSQSAGLTLVAATHVFLVEPVVNAGLEAQAINRVHRIGQRKATFVWRYIIRDTIEERVRELGNGNALGGAGPALRENRLESRAGGGGEVVNLGSVEWCLLGRKSDGDGAPDIGSGSEMQTADGNGGDGDVEMNDVVDDDADDDVVVFEGAGGPTLDDSATALVDMMRNVLERAEERADEHHGSDATARPVLTGRGRSGRKKGGSAGAWKNPMFHDQPDKIPSMRHPNALDTSDDSIPQEDVARASTGLRSGLPPISRSPSPQHDTMNPEARGAEAHLEYEEGASEPKVNPVKLRQENILARLKEAYPRFAPDQFGLTTDDLGAICNFDNRSNPALLEKLNGDYGGVEGVGYLLKANLEDGLPLVDTQPGWAPRPSAVVKRKNGKVMPIADGEDLEKGADVDAAAKPKVDMTPADMAVRQAVFGKNLIPPPRSDTILEIVWETIKDDPIIKVLIVGAGVVLALGTALCPKEGWIEGMAILVAVVIVLSVTAGNDWSKDRKFKKLLLLQSDKRTKVLRGGIKDQVSSWDVVVGDLVEVVVGDEIPADGLFVRGNRLVVDESPLTGESVPVKKGDFAPYMFSGCQVSEGSGVMLVTGVGPKSSGGQIQELLNAAQSEETVLQQKLKVVAVLIGKIGVASGILTFLALAVRWAVDWAKGNPLHEGTCGTASGSVTLGRIIQIVEDFVVGITVVVVAVPEGLPLAVTISLAFSMFKMIKDKCFVRHLDASETMGEATCICTDKTGTLTENRMTVVKALIGDQVHYGAGSGEDHSVPFSETTFEPRLRDILAEGIAVNSNCFVKYNEISGQPLFVGSATEGALLVFIEKLGAQYEPIRKNTQKVENGTWSFSSDRKRMSTLVQPAVPSAATAKPSKYRLYTKGASEIVLSLCTHMLDAKGTTATPIGASDVTRIQRTIKRWASQGLRTLALAYRDTEQQLATFEGGGKKDDPEHDLVFIGLVGIKDPLRKEVPGAVAVCQKAGLTIRMVTGDNILTACKIARECGIMFGDGVALEGPVFRAMTEPEKIAVIPRLQVLARSSPADKHTLVSLLKRMGEVVAVTGDGTNDAPALKEADVGFAMGISGTQIAMNASDIILLDDNFVSLVQSIRWGRNVLNCVRKFLQFQLGVNLVAIILTFVGSITVGASPLSTVQLLWVNLIMDSLGALALASDDPDDDILDHPPHARTEHLLSRPMREYIVIQVIYQMVVLLVLLLKGEDLVPLNLDHHQPADYEGTPSKRATTLVFTTFILCQISNEIAARQLNGELNPFRNFFRNKLFLFILLVIIAVQVVVVLVGQSFFQTTSLDGIEWVVCIVLAALNLPFVFICRCLFHVWHNGRGTTQTLTPVKSGYIADKTTVSATGSVSGSVTDIARTAPLSGAASIADRPGSGYSSVRPTGSNANLAGSVSNVSPYRATHRAGKRWQTVRSAVVLMGHLETVRSPEFQPSGPDPSFIENWRKFRKDTAGMPTKGSAMTRSAQSLADRRGR